MYENLYYDEYEEGGEYYPGEFAYDENGEPILQEAPYSLDDSTVMYENYMLRYYDFKKSFPIKVTMNSI